MYGPFVHRIDPVFGQIAGLYLWFYGLSYSLGFLSIFLWFKRVRRQFGLTIDAVYSLTIYLAVGVLVGGRLLEVFFYEWPSYFRHPVVLYDGAKNFLILGLLLLLRRSKPAPGLLAAHFNFGTDFSEFLSISSASTRQACLALPLVRLSIYACRCWAPFYSSGSLEGDALQELMTFHKPSLSPNRL